MLLLLGTGFAVVGLWPSFAFYGVLSLGTVLASIIPARGRGAWGRGDLLALVLGVGGLSLGAPMLLAPGLFDATAYDSIRPNLAVYGIALVACYSALIVVQVLMIQPRFLKRSVHFFAGVLLTVFMLKVAWRNPTSIALHGGFGLVVALQPWPTGRLPTIDPSSLRSRSALVLIVITVLPLIGSVVIQSDQASRVVVTQALLQQQALAVALAADADDYIRLHRAGATALASESGLLDSATGAQQSALHDFSTAYPNAVAFSLFDVDGRPIARSDNSPLPAAGGLAFFEDARRTNAPSIEVRISSVIRRPVFAFGARVLCATMNTT